MRSVILIGCIFIAIAIDSSVISSDDGMIVKFLAAMFWICVIFDIVEFFNKISKK